MGIKGLLPFLKKACHQGNVKEFSGCTVAVDTYCLLHKGAFGCADQLARGDPTDQYVNYCMKFVNLLLSFGIKPVLVFDGCRLPSKAGTEKRRREKRQLMKRRGKQFLREGKPQEARDCFQQCIDVTSQMALDVMLAARQKGVDCIVAPYEADAQLSYLNKCGFAQLVMTEDSDLVLFGCDRIIFKMDLNGNGVVYEKARLGEALGSSAAQFTFEKFRRMCILSGCDYLDNLPGIGLSKAMKFFKLARNTNLSVILSKVGSYLNMPGLNISSDYINNFIKAEKTFLYQLVFDPVTRRVVPLEPYPDTIDPDDLDFAGPLIDKVAALQLALGNLDVNTLKRLGDYDPDKPVPSPKTDKWTSNVKRSSREPHMFSIWDKNYKPRGQVRKPNPLEVVEHVIIDICIQPFCLILSKVGSYLNMPGLNISSDYINNFIKAEKTFLYQLVFDPVTRRVVPLEPYPDTIDPDDLDFAGPLIDKVAALQLALGNLDVNTLKRLGDYDPDKPVPSPKTDKWTSNVKRSSREPHMFSIWDKNYKPRGQVRKPNPLEVERAAPTKGKEVTIHNWLPANTVRRSPRKRPRDVQDSDSQQAHTDSELAAMYGGVVTPTPPLDKKPRTNVEPSVTRRAPEIRSRFFAARQPNIKQERLSTALMVTERVSLAGPDGELDCSTDGVPSGAVGTKPDRAGQLQCGQSPTTHDPSSNSDETLRRTSRASLHTNRLDRVLSRAAAIETASPRDPETTLPCDPETTSPCDPEMTSPRDPETVASRNPFRVEPTQRSSNTGVAGFVHRDAFKQPPVAVATAGTAAASPGGRTFDWDRYQSDFTALSGRRPSSQSPSTRRQYKLPSSVAAAAGGSRGAAAQGERTPDDGDSQGSAAGSLSQFSNVCSVDGDSVSLSQFWCSRSSQSDASDSAATAPGTDLGQSDERETSQPGFPCAAALDIISETTGSQEGSHSGSLSQEVGGGKDVVGGSAESRSISDRLTASQPSEKRFVTGEGTSSRGTGSQRLSAGQSKMSSCRRQGLAKRTVQGRGSSENQRSVKDMLHKFSYSKKQPTISSRPAPLSPCKSNVCTPDSRNSLLNSAAPSTQRTLYM
ncbi:PREDICTED: exonuclease 1-like [Priapulus caudatus]|uniref:Exonuclease 1 n=1 Tax=Priapulus caudatus TaxID=37621 RepID=A0ABM1E149_PRICU|nr:PREDICTED: exonuclease 1-like [Priapulus caudatus]